MTEKAYKNLNFLQSDSARTIRILSEYLEPQARFKSLPAAAIESLQQEVDAKWETYRSQMT